PAVANALQRAPRFLSRAVAGDDLVKGGIHRRMVEAVEAAVVVVQRWRTNPHLVADGPCRGPGCAIRLEQINGGAEQLIPDIGGSLGHCVLTFLVSDTILPLVARVSPSCQGRR